MRAYILEDGGKLIVIDLCHLPAELEKLGFKLLTGVWPGDDGDDHALLRIAAATYLRGIARAKPGGPGEVEPRQAL